MIQRLLCRFGRHDWQPWTPDPSRCENRRACRSCGLTETESFAHALDGCRCVRCGESVHAGPFKSAGERGHVCDACGEIAGHDVAVRYEWEDLGAWDSDFGSYENEVEYSRCRVCGFETSRVTEMRRY